MDLQEFARRARGDAFLDPQEAADCMAYLKGDTDRRPLTCTERRQLAEARALAAAEKHRARKLAERKAKDRQRRAASRTFEGALLEYQQTAAALTVDADKPIIRGVRVLGLKSANRRRYTQEAVKRALPRYQNCEVFIDHPWRGCGKARSVTDRFGRLQNVRVGQDGSLWADLHFNPKHPFAPAVSWWAEHDPTALGLSHNAAGQGFTEADGTLVVQDITKVESVDLVHSPATNAGLFT